MAIKSYIVMAPMTTIMEGAHSTFQARTYTIDLKWVNLASGPGLINLGSFKLALLGKKCLQKLTPFMPPLITFTHWVAKHTKDHFYVLRHPRCLRQVSRVAYLLLDV